MRFQSRLACLLVMAGMLTSVSQAPAGETQEVSIGDTIADVTFKDIRYLPRRLSEFGEHPAYVAVFGTSGLSQDLLEAQGVECDTRAMHGAPDWLPAAMRAEREWR